MLLALVGFATPPMIALSSSLLLRENAEESRLFQVVLDKPPDFSALLAVLLDHTPSAQPGYGSWAGHWLAVILLHTEGWAGTTRSPSGSPEPSVADVLQMKAKRGIYCAREEGRSG
jgi:hypothetical protein